MFQRFVEIAGNKQYERLGYLESHMLLRKSDNPCCRTRHINNFEFMVEEKLKIQKRSTRKGFQVLHLQRLMKLKHCH